MRGDPNVAVEGRLMKTRKLSDEIADRLRAMILQGVLRPGDRIHSERHLSETMSASRPIIREALALLESEGLLQIKRGGLHVRELTAEPILEPLVALFRSEPTSFEDYLEFREVIEGAASYLAALRATQIDRSNLQQAYGNFVKSHDHNDPRLEAATDAEFHIAIYEACHNLAILHIMRGTASLLRNDVFFNRSRLYGRVGYKDATIEQHRLIFEAIMNGNPEAARAAAEAHITFVRKAVEELKQAEARLDVARRRAVERTQFVAID
jgi:GntR family transcriptional regulator, transcriptional repressor for pyruvate dehydrogenase complex